jgi:hypothetical protein
MAPCLTCSRLCGGLLALTAEDRLQAARRMPPDRLAGFWMWGLIALGAAIAAAAGIALAVAQRRRRRRRAWDSFNRHADQAGLNDEERSFLANLTRLAGLARPNTIFTAEAAFDEAVRHGHLDRLSNAMQKTARATVHSLRQKLGFGPPQPVRKAASASTRQIPEGARVELSPRGTLESVEAVLARNDEAGLHVQPVRPATCAPGELLQVRYSNMGTVWEFDAVLRQAETPMLVLEHTEKIRFVNRRRFPRVPTDRKAIVAALPLLRTGGDELAPSFAPATLVEIAGPGLRLRTELPAEIEDRVVAAVRVDDARTLQGPGRVRRVQPAADGHPRELAIELIDLEADEVAQLSRLTNEAAQQNAAWRATAPAAAAGAPA